MSKSIYEEALEILRDSLQDPQDEDNDCYMLNLLQMNKITKALKQAEKKEKLLELYKELIAVKDEVISVAYFDTRYYNMGAVQKEIDLKKQIKRLENE